MDSVLGLSYRKDRKAKNATKKQAVRAQATNTVPLPLHHTHERAPEGNNIPHGRGQNNATFSELEKADTTAAAEARLCSVVLLCQVLSA